MILVLGPVYAILARVNRFTKQEQLVLCIVVGLLLTGWAVKAYRAAHPPVQAAETVGF
jgi:hypothetical protein